MKIIEEHFKETKKINNKFDDFKEDLINKLN